MTEDAETLLCRQLFLNAIHGNEALLSSLAFADAKRVNEIFCELLKLNRSSRLERTPWAHSAEDAMRSLVNRAFDVEGDQVRLKSTVRTRADIYDLFIPRKGGPNIPHPLSLVVTNAVTRENPHRFANFCALIESQITGDVLRRRRITRALKCASTSSLVMLGPAVAIVWALWGLCAFFCAE